MSKKLKLVSRITNETGMQFGVVGVLVALAGTALAFWMFPVAGYWIGAVGIMLVFIGMVLHFVMNWRAIFRVDR